MPTSTHMRTLKIGRSLIGNSHPCFIVAEIGINFDGKYSQAIQLIDVAAKAGCNAVKFQLFTAERMYVARAGAYATARGEKRDIVEVVRSGELPPTWIPKLRQHAYARGLAWFSTVCDEQSGDILERHGTDAFKFASYEITHLPLFRHVAQKGMPIILSSGGAALQEVAEAIATIRTAQNAQIALLHCVGQYPAPRDTLNLNVLKMFQLVFPDIVIGYSDHSFDPIEAPRAAVALGAKIVEKHITIDRALPGIDHAFAVDPPGLAQMVQAIRDTERALRAGRRIHIDPTLLGTSERTMYGGERYVRNFAYRCLFATQRIRKGERFTRRNMAALRPGQQPRGLDPKYYDVIIGYRATRDLCPGQRIVWADILQP